MNLNNSNILLVEGESDRGFFEQICKLLQLNITIKVAIPKDYQGNLRNTKQGVLIALQRLLNDIIDENAETKRLAIAIDADYKNKHGLGFEDTLNQVKTIAADYDFNLNESKDNGLIFHHIDGNAQFGLWIMPNNQDNGELEDFIKSCIKNDEQLLFNYAIQTIEQLPEKRFDITDTTKAEIATWLAWQKKPSHGVYIALKDSLLNQENELFKELKNWLNHIYNTEN